MKRRQKPIFSSLEGIKVESSEVQDTLAEPVAALGVPAEAPESRIGPENHFALDSLLPGAAGGKPEPGAQEVLARPPGKVRLSAECYDFGQVLMGAHEDRLIPIYNDGEGEIVIEGLTGLPSKGFSLVEPPVIPQSIPPRGSMDLTVRFTPEKVGKKAIALSIATRGMKATVPRVQLMGMATGVIQAGGAEYPPISDSPPVSPVHIPAKPLVETGAKRSSERVKEICYTHTKTVPVDLNTLIRNRLIVGSTNTMIVQGYKLLRTHILQKTWEEHRNVLMVTSPLPDDGKTVTTINLAISMAQEMDKTVLLVDADLHGPSIHRYFGMPAGKGLVDYLEGKMSLPDLLVHPKGLDRLVILPGGKPSQWATELIRSPRWQG